jgi:hypothetical protein
VSYDLSLEIDAGGRERATICDVGNCTSNLSEMFYRAIDVGSGFTWKNGLHDLHGRTGEEVIPTLCDAVKDMIDDQRWYREKNPTNGWGDFIGARDYLTKLLIACVGYPKAIIRLSA